MKIQAKFACHNVREVFYGTDNTKSAEVVTLNPVYSDSGPNKTWNDATPSGVVEMYISNPSAWGAFELHKEYIVDFRPANPGE